MLLGILVTVPLRVQAARRRSPPGVTTFAPAGEVTPDGEGAKSSEEAGDPVGTNCNYGGVLTIPTDFYGKRRCPLRQRLKAYEAWYQHGREIIAPKRVPRKSFRFPERPPRVSERDANVNQSNKKDKSSAIAGIVDDNTPKKSLPTKTGTAKKKRRIRVPTQDELRHDDIITFRLRYASGRRKEKPLRGKVVQTNSGTKKVEYLDGGGTTTVLLTDVCLVSKIKSRRKGTRAGGRKKKASSRPDTTEPSQSKGASKLLSTGKSTRGRKKGKKKRSSIRAAMKGRKKRRGKWGRRLASRPIHDLDDLIHP